MESRSQAKQARPDRSGCSNQDKYDYPPPGRPLKILTGHWVFEVKAERLLRIVVEGMQILFLHPLRRQGGCQNWNEKWKKAFKPKLNHRGRVYRIVVLSWRHDLIWWLIMYSKSYKRYQNRLYRIGALPWRHGLYWCTIWVMSVTTNLLKNDRQMWTMIDRRLGMTVGMNSNCMGHPGHAILHTIEINAWVE